MARGKYSRIIVRSVTVPGCGYDLIGQTRLAVYLYDDIPFLIDLDDLPKLQTGIGSIEIDSDGILTGFQLIVENSVIFLNGIIRILFSKWVIDIKVDVFVMILIRMIVDRFLQKILSVKFRIGMSYRDGLGGQVVELVKEFIADKCRQAFVVLERASSDLFSFDLHWGLT